MAIKHVNLSIRRDELTVLKTTVAEWEVPLLFLVHGEEMVQVLPGEPWANVDPPDVLDEYRRLEAKYRMPANEDGSPGQRAVGLVYGSFGASPQLRQAIQAATFERKTDLLGLADLEAAAKVADEAAAKARQRLTDAQAASAKTDEDEDEPEVPVAGAKRRRRGRPRRMPRPSRVCSKFHPWVGDAPGRRKPARA
jgi:hypothetical protein